MCHIVGINIRNRDKFIYKAWVNTTYEANLFTRTNTPVINLMEGNNNFNNNDNKSNSSGENDGNNN